MMLDALGTTREGRFDIALYVHTTDNRDGLLQFKQLEEAPI